MEPAPDLSPDAWGIQPRWYGADGRLRELSEETVRSLRDAIGEPPADLDERAPLVTRPGRDLGTGPVDVLFEDGATGHLTDGRLPDNFPLGYHRLSTADGVERRLIVSPGRCWLPEDLRAWGWTVQVYATRSRDSWGIGDLADLAALRRWASAQGAGFLMVNPLHAVACVAPMEDSPYLPATRRFRNPVYLRVDDAPAELRDRGRALNDLDLVDRAKVWAVKEESLRRRFAVLADDPDESAAFDRWRAAQGEPLEQFATWSALTQQHGADWREWDPALRDPQGTAVAEFARRHADDVAFHAWLQWHLDRQLREATGDLTVVQDLPIGVDGGGADAWAWQDVVAGGVTVGAPPDFFNAQGQSWGSPPFIPWRLRAADYEPFVDSIRATMSGAGGVRIDHIMGLFRLWWIPEGASPEDGAYVRYPSRELLDIVALESHRAEALVIGEDLGTVEEGVRETLAEYGILSYKLLWFEQDDPATWPTGAMAAVTTHDLPTVAGLWTGADVVEQAEYVDVPRDELDRGRQELLARLGDIDAGASVEEAVVRAHRLIARAPCRLLAATLEDAVADVRRPNLPGVVVRPNWRLPLPVLVEDLPQHPLAVEVGEILRAGTGG